MVVPSLLSSTSKTVLQGGPLLLLLLPRPHDEHSSPGAFCTAGCPHVPPTPDRLMVCRGSGRSSLRRRRCPPCASGASPMHTLLALALISGRRCSCRPMCWSSVLSARSSSRSWSGSRRRGFPARKHELWFARALGGTFARALAGSCRRALVRARRDLLSCASLDMAHAHTAYLPMPMVMRM